MQVAEYFLFDPRGEYLSPALQGYRLIEGQYVPIEPVSGRLPSVELGLAWKNAAVSFGFSIRPPAGICQRVRRVGMRLKPKRNDWLRNLKSCGGKSAVAEPGTPATPRAKRETIL